ncbi:MAG TPA: hypothetical protein VJ998_07910 [Pseudomonadales bacterium]|nr:hypothetical protein [Pseudomonadales bacterium]
MKIHRFNKFLLAASLAAASTTAAAEPQGLNLKAGNYFDIDDPYVGIGYDMPVAPRWSIDPNMEYIFVNTGSLYTFNVDAKYQLNPAAANPMWLGAGVGMIRRTGPFPNSTDSAVNLGWGIDFAGYKGGITPFISTKAVFSDNSDFAVSFGVRFGSGSGTNTTAYRSSQTSAANHNGR